MINDTQRPSPDALLAEAKREGKGKLKIFLGAAPGVGKTYAMLRAAQTRRAEGIDVVIGYVETHRRNDTDALMDGLEKIPTLTFDYRGLSFQEMDVDAIIKRKPRLALIDELAHTNIQGARHVKRYQDVFDVLDAGIDVYTTLNVQHIESLNDIVARITGVTVRETLPDSVLQRADSIELIDLPPEELLQRLKDGKVYIPEQARLAMSRFFTPGNLTALRELALRQAAAQVDDQMVNYMRRHAISGPWPTADRIMVCISDDGQAIPLVRTAKRSAERRKAAWTTLYIETHRHSMLSEQTKRTITQALHLTESLGGEALSVAGEDIAGEILRIAHERNVSVIIIGKTRRSFWSHLSRPSVAAQVLKHAQSFDVMLMSVKDDPRQRVIENAGSKIRVASWRHYIKALFVMVVASIIAYVVSPYNTLTALTYIYLAGILLIAAESGFGTSLMAAILAALATDILFVEPKGSFAIDDGQDAVVLSFFFMISCVIGYIGGQLRQQVAVTRRHAQRTQALYEFNRRLAVAVAAKDVEQSIVQHIAQSLQARTALYLPRGDRLECVAACPEDMRMDVTSNAAIGWAWEHEKPAGKHTDTLPSAPFHGLVLKTVDEKIGVLAFSLDGDDALSPDQEMFLNNMANLSASALLRTKLASDVENARLQNETERLRTGLLTSISQDLRQPLAAILGTASSLNDHWDSLNDQARRALFHHIEDDAERLNRFMQNFLDMSALVTGALHLKREAVPVDGLVQLALTKLARAVGDRPLSVDVPSDLPKIDGDMVLLERVLVNVLDNACQYAPADQPITITARHDGHYIRIVVTDRGVGIPANERERVFNMFYRVKVGSVAANGVGLGLAICRGFVEAHGGRITAHAGSDGIGTQIAIRLPVMAS